MKLKRIKNKNCNFLKENFGEFPLFDFQTLLAVT